MPPMVWSKSRIAASSSSPRALVLATSMSWCVATALATSSISTRVATSISRHGPDHLLAIVLENRRKVGLQQPPDFASRGHDIRVDAVDAEPDLKCRRDRHET